MTSAVFSKVKNLATLRQFQRPLRLPENPKTSDKSKGALSPAVNPPPGGKVANSIFCMDGNIEEERELWG